MSELRFNPERRSRSRSHGALPTWAILPLYGALLTVIGVILHNSYEVQNIPSPHLLLNTLAFQNPESAIDPNAPFIRLEVSCSAQQPELGKFINPRLDLNIQVTGLDTTKNLTRTLALRDTNGELLQTLASQPANLADMSVATNSGSVNNRLIQPQQPYEIYVLRRTPVKPDTRIRESNVVEAKLAFDTPTCPPEK